MKTSLITVWSVLALVLVVFHNNRGHNTAWAKSRFSWLTTNDQFDEINNRISYIDAKNCRNKDKDELTLPKDTVSQIPVYNELLSRVWYSNRSSLIHLHNMALNRAFFYSYVLQKMNDSATFYKQPNWMYFYFSATADVNANPSVLNGSAFYFDTHCHYPNWYTTVAFNRTLPLFGPKIFRWDDYSDQGNFLREPTRTTVKGMDAGTGRFMNYTHPRYKMNPWYENWLPDIDGDMDSLTKFTYYIGIKESNVTGHFITDEYVSFAFFGPNSPSASDRDSQLLPVQFTAPYFDCGGSDKWVVSAVSPVVDYMPRYSNFTHLRRQRIVGVSVMDIDFVEVDFNACNVGTGNPGPSYLSGIHRCHKSTSCKQAAGFGFRRGGYSCVCKNGFQHPFFSDRPYRGAHIEQATEYEYHNGFQCTPTDYRLVLPVVDQTSTVAVEAMAGGGIQGGLPDDLRDSIVRNRRHAGNASLATESHYMEGHVHSRNFSDLPDLSSTRRMGTAYDRQHSTDPRYRLKDITVMEAEQAPDAPREASHEEMIALAEKLRELRESNKLRQYLKLHRTSHQDDTNATLEEDEYATQNNVDFSIEREYEADLKQHRMYRDFLIEADRSPGRQPNSSRVSQLLREDALQMRERHQQRFHANRLGLSRKKRSSVFDNNAFDRMLRIFRWKSSVTGSNCHEQPNHRLTLPGDVGYGADKQFQNEARTAVRLSNFLSLYLQNVMPDENFGDLRGGGPLHKDMMFGEVIANVMGNYKIYGAGVFFDRYKFENDDGSPRELFGPWAYRKRGAFYAEDQAGYSYSYVDSDWFRQAKARHGTNFHGTKTFKLRAYVRNNPQGTSSVKHEFFPVKYRAAPYELGFWTKPHFRCDGNVDTWVLTYVSPFFGLDSLRTKLEFRGVTTVDVPLSFLDINPCPMPFYVANAFKNTARCDYFSTQCRPMPSFPFTRGSYRCNCRLGFEYWHADNKGWVEGSLLELEYEKKRMGYFSRFDNLKCRPSAASTVSLQLYTVILLAAIAMLLPDKRYS